MNSIKSDILRLPLFQGFGVELEYMVVDKDSLNVLPITDKIMHAVTGAYEDEVDRGEISWSNELALHVIEFKTNGPSATLKGLDSLFLNHVQEVNQILSSFHGRLMPTAMHPWMDPFKETHLWPHAYNPIYESYHRIFDCRGHGWSNLQSAHLNLPFANDAEFAKLHAAIRILLPIMPAIAASSPVMDGKASGLLDTRLQVYLGNAKAIPSITGKVVPEASLSQKDYEAHILQPMYKDIASLDPEGILQYEWLNSRGAIARFDRFTIEIRVLDVQECPAADLAIVHLIVETLKMLTSDQGPGVEAMNSIALDSLYQLFLDCMKEGEKAIIKEPNYLALFGLNAQTHSTTGELWTHLFRRSATLSPTMTPPIKKALTTILEQGPLARRILSALKNDYSKRNIERIYRHLCDCLEHGEMLAKG